MAVVLFGLFLLDVLWYPYTFGDGAVLSLLAFKLNWAGGRHACQGGRIAKFPLPTTVAFSMVELFQKICTEKSWCDLSAWDAAGSEWLHLRDLVAPGFANSALWGWAKIEVKLALLGAQDHVKLVVVAPSTPQARWKCYLKQSLGVYLQLGT